MLFIDEIHRLSRAVEEILYPAMEDFQLDIVLGKGPAARSIRLDLPRFTLVGATTRTGLITGPLRDRFGLVARLDYYDAGRARAIVVRAAGILGVDIDAGGAGEIARRARGTPRIANRLLRRVRDFAEVRGDGAIDAGHRPRRAGAVRCRRPRPRQGRPRHPRRPSASASAAARSACRRSPSASASRPRPSRTSTSRSSSSRACSCARREVGWPRPRPGPTSAWSRRRARPMAAADQPPSLFELSVRLGSSASAF